MWKFHAIYWPALLLSAGLSLPNEIIVHGFLTEQGNKISKSRGRSIDPLELIEEFGADAVRYYLLEEVSPFNDGDFSIERFKKTYETKLANNLGNLVSRLTSLCEKASYGNYTETSAPKAPEGYHETFKNYEFDKVLGILWKVVSELNQDIDYHKPWTLLKEANNETINGLLTKWLKELQRVAYWLIPFLPDSSNSISSILSKSPIRSSGSLFPKTSN